MAEDRLRSWVPGYSDTGLSVTLHPGTEDVLESCVTALAQGLSMADCEADPSQFLPAVCEAHSRWTEQ